MIFLGLDIWDWVMVALAAAAGLGWLLWWSMRRRYRAACNRSIGQTLKVLDLRDQLAAVEAERDRLRVSVALELEQEDGR